MRHFQKRCPFRHKSRLAIPFFSKANGPVDTVEIVEEKRAAQPLPKGRETGQGNTRARARARLSHWVSECVCVRACDPAGVGVRLRVRMDVLVRVRE